MDILEFLRQFRIGPLTIFDTLIAYLGVFLIAPWLTKVALKVRLHVSKAQWLWLVLPFSIFTHLIFGQGTPLTKMFIDQNNFYLVKIVILVMLFMGLRGIRITKK